MKRKRTKPKPLAERTWPWSAPEYRLTDADVALAFLSGEFPGWTYETFNSEMAKVGDLYWSLPNPARRTVRPNDERLLVYRLEKARNNPTAATAVTYPLEWSIVYMGERR